MASILCAMRSGAKRLSQFPRNRLLEDELIRCRVSELDLLAAFERPTKETLDEDELEPTFFWDLEFPCEMVMALQFRQLSQILTIRLDEPELDHALRHLGFEVKDLTTLETVNPERYASLCEDLDPAYELWHTDEHGNKVCVASGLVARDAECRRAELAATSLHQASWVSRAD